MKLLFLLQIFLILSSSLIAKEIFVIENNAKTKIDIPKYVEFYETRNRFWSGQSASYTDLTKAKWTDKLQSEQSYLRGFWIKFEVHNKTNNLYFGLSHENLDQSIVYAEVRNNIEKHIYCCHN